MMTPEELTQARAKLGLTARAFAPIFGVTDRTVRAWENGDSNAREIPRAIALLVKLAVKYPAVRRELGIAKKAPDKSEPAAT